MIGAGPNLIVMGSGAGGGVPQWNCGCRLCALARAGDARVAPRTQTQVAASADAMQWVLIGASPDLRQQILATPELAPSGLRGSPIVSVVLVSADIDGIAGLLTLREGHAFRILAPPSILAHLAANSVFGVLDPARVPRVALDPGVTVEAAAGLSVTLLPMPGKVPLYRERPGAAQAEAGPAYAARLEAAGRVAIVAPACAEVTEAVRTALRPADLLLFDATVFEDDDMIAAGVGGKTGRRMAHVPLAGPGGSLAALRDLPARKVLLHVNNTNPVLDARSAARAAIREAGFELASDGMRLHV